KEGIGALIQTLGGELPKAWQEAAKAAETFTGRAGAAASETGEAIEGVKDTGVLEIDALRQALEDDRGWRAMAADAQTAAAGIEASLARIPRTVPVSVL